MSKRKKIIYPDSNEPTRVEFIDAVLDLEIGSAKQKRDRGTPITIDYYIDFLKDIRVKFVEWEFAVDRNPPGPKRNSKRLTKQQQSFKVFIKEQLESNNKVCVELY